MSEPATLKALEMCEGRIILMSDIPSFMLVRVMTVHLGRNAISTSQPIQPNPRLPRCLGFRVSMTRQILKREKGKKKSPKSEG